MVEAADELFPGHATGAGTAAFAQRFAELPDHFRQPDDLKISSLGLGTRNGNPGGIDDLLYRSAVPQLLQGGVNLFDTALSDRMQTSERALGTALRRAFREADAARNEVVVVTKGGYLTVDPLVADSQASARRYLMETYVEPGLIDVDGIANGVHSLDPPFLRDQIARSRRNLGLATIDFYLLEEPEIHRHGSTASGFRNRLCRAFEALEEAVVDGHIRAFGLCTWDGFLLPHTERDHLSLLDVFQWAMDVGGGDHHLRALQLPYSLAMVGALKLPSQIGPAGGTDAILSSLRGTGTVVFASAPLVQGRASRGLPDLVRRVIPGLRTDAQRCLQFARSAPGITSAVAGMREPDHIDENLEVARVAPLSPDAIDRLFKEGDEGRTPGGE